MCCDSDHSNSSSNHKNHYNKRRKQNSSSTKKAPKADGEQIVRNRYDSDIGLIMEILIKNHVCMKKIVKEQKRINRTLNDIKHEIAGERFRQCNRENSDTYVSIPNHSGDKIGGDARSKKSTKTRSAKSISNGINSLPDGPSKSTRPKLRVIKDWRRNYGRTHHWLKWKSVCEYRFLRSQY